jgi:integrase
MELQGVCRNITYSVTPPKKSVDVSDTDKIDVWEDKDLQKLVSATESHRLRLLAILAVNTGGRLAELLAIEPDKDIRDGILYITKQLIEKSAKKDGVSHYLDELKTPSSRRAIPLSDEVLHEINIHRKWQREEMMANGYRTTLLFTTDSGGFYYRKNIHTAFERLYKKLNIPFHKFHAFRHTFGTNLSRAGVPIEETSKLMGHSDISVTAKYYINVSAERKRNAIEKILQYSFGE